MKQTKKNKCVGDEPHPCEEAKPSTTKRQYTRHHKRFSYGSGHFGLSHTNDTQRQKQTQRIRDAMNRIRQAQETQ